LPGTALFFQIPVKTNTMGLPRWLLTAFSLLFFYVSFSQAICGFDLVQGRKIKEDPIYRQKILNYESNLRKYIQQHPLQSISKTQSNAFRPTPKTLSGPPYVIPVVVHIVTTGGPVGSIYNPTDAQVQGTIAYLNEVYNGTYPGTQGAGNLQIQFVLAQRDPNCNPTNGIDHIDGSGIAGYTSGGVNVQTTVGTDEINVKNLIRWDPTQYYNIWVVDKIDGNDGTSGTFVAGYAYFPGGDPNYDGTVLLATQMIAGQKTLPHELGHGFNLYHPFQNPADPTSSTCPINANCNTDGDQICDTDPITEPINFVCRTGTINPCTGTVYTINTESNYMNYTNCSTLFTADQNTRMLASAASPDRVSLTTSLGGTAPDAGSTQCIPKIDFELANDQVTEATTVTTGCRAYTDYTYNMVIGNLPSAATTATLAVISGTATEGMDFDITTNGNFSSPSKTINFPAGSTSSQSFTVRIYDDASVEGTESFTLGFSVNNGGGNAVAGDGRSTLTITINDNDVAPYGPVNTTKSIGSSLGLLLSPFAAANSKQKSQILYYASELSSVGIAAGNILGLALNLSKNSGSAFVYNSLTIKIGSTVHASLYNGSTEFPLSDASFTTVYSANYTSISGWNNFTFTTPFVWDGSSNLVVEICYDDGVATDQTDNTEAYTDGSANSNYVFQSGINCGGSFSSFSLYNSGFKPIVEFIYADPGTQVQTLVNSSRQQYLGPNADIYFYDQTNNQLMARIQNLSNFNYDCTQVIIDRAGTGTTPFWNNNPADNLMDKTFHVIPTNNNASGSYIITLYYTQAEINGWQTATGQSVSNIQLAKVPSQISNTTPANPTGAGVVTQGNPTVSTLGTNTALTYNFTNGFSGFGAGVFGVALPIELLSFEGQLKDHFANLQWTTSIEVNSKTFEIERSYDDSIFSSIGTIPAAGTSATQRNYSFKDPDIAQAMNYYRLKEIDMDGNFQYSKQILLQQSSAAYDYRVISNPFLDQVIIEFGQPQTGKIITRLLDITGRQMIRQVNEGSALTIIHMDVSNIHLSSGVYLLEIQYNNEVHAERVIKQ
jgi:hypothetical protein